MRRVIPFMISFVIMLSLSACAAEKDAGTGAEQDQVSNGQQETETLLTMDITDEPTLGQTEEMEIGVFDFEKRSVLLNSGYEMPIMGLGTYSLDYDTCVSSVKALLVSGGRLIDTAYMYHNEEVYCKG